MMRYDVLILFAGIGIMYVAISGKMPEDFLPWVHERLNKYKEGRTKK